MSEPSEQSAGRSKSARIARLAASGAVWFGLAALSGCVVLGPDYKRPELELPTVWRAPLPDPAEMTNTAWWEAFGDDELNTLIKRALDANKDLIVATLRLEQYDARLEISRAANYPQVRGGFTGERQRRSQERPNGLRPGDSPDLNNFELSATMSWELDLWGRVKRSNEAALADLVSNEESRRAVMLTVVSSVAATYVQLLGFDQQLTLAKQTLKNRQDAFRLIDQKNRGGSANLLAVTQARASVEAVAATVPDIERQIATLENALSSLLGRPTAPIVRRSMEALAMPVIPQGVPSDVLTRRPDVRAAEQKLVAANALIGIAKAEYFPKLTLTGALGLASDDLSYLGAKTARDANFGAALLAPLFTGGRIEGDVRQAEAVQKQTAVSYQLAVQTALQEVEDALVARAKSGEQLEALGRYVAALQEVAALSRQRYTGGQASYLEVLESDLQLYAAQRKQTLGRTDTYASLISVYKAMGGGWMVAQDEGRLRSPALPASQASPAADVKLSAANEAETPK